MYRLDVLVQGYPGKSLCHGGLGWSTIACLRGTAAATRGRTVLIDVGAFSIRPEFARQLANAEVAPESVTDVVLTHAHWDHSVNFPLFPNAEVWIGRTEMAWATGVPVGFNSLPELYVQALAQHPRLHLLDDSEQFLPGFSAHLCAGHTPGCLSYRVTGTEQPLLFSGDAAKNRAELLSMVTDMTMDAGASRTSLERIWGLWRDLPDTLLIPGHDLTMRLDASGRPEYLGERRAGINSWFSEDLLVTTPFDLTEPRF